MSWISGGWQWLRSIARRRGLERELDEEMRFHLDQQTEKYRRAGMSPDEARRQALVRFGGVTRIKETTVDEIRPALLDDSMRDIRQGLRMLRRSPGFTAAALLTLALGIGATSAIFSVVRTVMLEPLPYRDPERVVAVWEINRSGNRNVIAPANFVAWRERTQTLDHLGMVGSVTLAMIINAQPDQIQGLLVSADVFQALGVQPALGRVYTPEEDLGGMPVIVISHDFWQRRLGGRADVLDMTLTADGRRRTILGVMPAGFTIVGRNADYLLPFGQTMEQFRAVSGRGNAYGLARLKDGVSLAQASSEMRRIFVDRQKEAPQLNAGRSVTVLPLQEQMVGELRPALFTLIGAVVLVLLVACVNVANLLLARSAAREREVGLRSALGARRGRLVRQMLTESLVLAVIGGAAGLAVAAWCHRGLLALVGDRIPVPRLEQLTLDLPMIAFTLVTAIATGVLFGVVPALVSTSHTRDALRDGGRHGGGHRLRRVLSALVVVEVALSLVLLAGAGLLMRSFVKLQSIDPGFRPDGVLVAGVSLPAARYDPAHASQFFDETRARLSALPGVHAVAGTPCPPLAGPCIGTSYSRTDRPAPASGQASSALVRPVTPAFFETMGIVRVAGRDFAASDTAPSLPVAIVSASLVRQHFDQEDPIGHSLRVNVGQTPESYTIIGVVGDIKLLSLDEAPRPAIYLAAAQLPGQEMRFLLRTSQDPMSLANSVRTAVHAREPEAPVIIRTLDEIVGSTIARPRAISVLVGVFALVALVLAAVGVYGVMAYSVRERTQEIGIRMALGASASSVFRLVIGQALRLVVIGVVAGLFAAGALAQLLKRLLYEVEPLDPWTFAGTAVLLLTVAAIASYVPARRGMHMAPVDALRTK